MGQGPNASTVHLEQIGTDFCDTEAARGNVWYEVRDWFPQAALHLAAAGCSLTIPVILALIAIFSCNQCFTVSDKIMGTLLLLCFVLIAGPFAASLALGAPAFADFTRGGRESTDWQMHVLKESPQTGLEYSLANNCAWSFIVFSAVFGIIYCVGCPFALPYVVLSSVEIIRERRRARRIRAPAENGADGMER